MHVLIIPSWYPSSPTDIRGSFFREQALALKKYGCQVGVIYPAHCSLRQRLSMLIGGHKQTTENDNDIPTLRRHCIRWSSRIPYIFPWLDRTTLTLLGLRLFKKYVAQHGTPDILHAHSTLYGGIIAEAISDVTDIPYVITEHSSAYPYNLIRPTEKRIAKKAVMNAAHRMAVSAPFCELLLNYFDTSAGKWFPMPNIVSARFAQPQSNNYKQQRGNFIFLCIAGLNTNKAIDNLITAFTNAFNHKHKITLRIGGNGPERRTLEELAKSLGVTDQIQFLGKLTREEVMQEMTNADVFVLPSHFETFGVVVVEALATGKPVVATRCGGPESIVRPQDGILVPTNDIQALSIAMQKIRHNIGSYNPQEIRDSCLARYSEKVITAKLKAVYRNVLSPNPPDVK